MLLVGLCVVYTEIQCRSLADREAQKLEHLHPIEEFGVHLLTKVNIVKISVENVKYDVVLLPHGRQMDCTRLSSVADLIVAKVLIIAKINKQH